MAHGQSKCHLQQKATALPQHTVGMVVVRIAKIPVGNTRARIAENTLRRSMKNFAINASARQQMGECIGHQIAI